MQKYKPVSISIENDIVDSLNKLEKLNIKKSKFIRDCLKKGLKELGIIGTSKYILFIYDKNENKAKKVKLEAKSVLDCYSKYFDKQFKDLKIAEKYAKDLNMSLDINIIE